MADEQERLPDPVHPLGDRRDGPVGPRPFVTVKLAQTLDGRIATATGHSQWISGEASLRLAHQLRAEHDAVLVGIGTVLSDDPRLTVRLVDGPNPLRIVVDTTLRTPLSCHPLSDDPDRTTIFVGPGAAGQRIANVRQLGAEVVIVPLDAVGRLDLEEVLARLADRGIRSLMVEGGAAIVTSLLRLAAVDRMVISIAPKLVGDGLEAIGDLGIRRLGDAICFAGATVCQLGPDIVFDGRIERTAGAAHLDRRAALGHP
jgi:diaminohydroxyphosphoribosylaminopyrimidine deaminase / 5-amino-6-(5-phosphoribosylamino)uracil reductase